jgi:hypothetical protein
MSEYQYYEFEALDRTLTQHDMRELRKYSTHATITATRFPASSSKASRFSSWHRGTRLNR